MESPASSLGCLEEIEGVTITRLDKARIHAYLAAKPSPNASVGVAARKGYWNPQHPVFSRLRRFLTTLNGSESRSSAPDAKPRYDTDTSGMAR